MDPQIGILITLRGNMNFGSLKRNPCRPRGNYDCLTSTVWSSPKETQTTSEGLTPTRNALGPNDIKYEHHKSNCQIMHKGWRDQYQTKGLYA